jgi:hypothetical protein
MRLKPSRLYEVQLIPHGISGKKPTPKIRCGPHKQRRNKAVYWMQ